MSQMDSPSATRRGVPEAWRRLVLAFIGAVGTALFGFFLFLTFHTPDRVEAFAASYIEQQVAERLDRGIDALQAPTGTGRLARLAGALQQGNEAAIERQREWLRAKAHEQLASALAQVRDPACACRQSWSDWLERGTQASILQLAAENQALRNFIHATYAQTVQDVKRELRIFIGANLAVFVLLLLAAALKPRATTHLFVPGLLLALATLVCSWFYLFEQNWLLTIIHGQYLGFLYFGYLGIAFAFLCDIVLNRARITTKLLNTLLNAIGSAISVVPC